MNPGHPASPRKLARRGQTMVVKSHNTKPSNLKKSKREQILERCTPFSRRLPKPFLICQEGKFKDLEAILSPNGVLLPATELSEILGVKHTDGTSIVHHAVVGGSIEVLQLLIKCQVDLSVPDIEGLLLLSSLTFF